VNYRDIDSDEGEEEEEAANDEDDGEAAAAADVRGNKVITLRRSKKGFAHVDVNVKASITDSNNNTSIASNSLGHSTSSGDDIVSNIVFPPRPWKANQSRPSAHTAVSSLSQYELIEMDERVSIWELEAIQVDKGEIYPEGVITLAQKNARENAGAGGVATRRGRSAQNNQNQDNDNASNNLANSSNGNRTLIDTRIISSISAEEEAICLQALDRYCKFEQFMLFTEPVSHVELPTYMWNVAYPMDMKTMKQRVMDKYYRQLVSFLHDAKQISVACNTFNEENSDIALHSKVLSYYLCQYVKERVAPARIPAYFTMPEKPERYQGYKLDEKRA
jgi:hypothetical protein